jgi:AcrR family transcriptional regulator
MLCLMSNRDPRQLILDAALAVFVKAGFERATTTKIVARARISNGALFHYFPTKDAIAEALYLRGLASYQEGLIKALQQHRDPKAAQATVRAAVHHHLAWVEANRELAWFMYERGRPDWQPAHGAEVRKLNRTTAVHVRDWMTPLVRSGVIRNLPLTALAALINGPAHFVARRWLSGLATARPTSFTDVLADAAWAAIAPHRTRPSPAPRRVCASALIETAAFDAVHAQVLPSPRGAWSIVCMTMNSTADGAAFAAESAIVRSIRTDDGSHLATVEIEVADADGRATAGGSVVCVWREEPAGTAADGGQTGGSGNRRQT